MDFCQQCFPEKELERQVHNRIVGNTDDTVPGIWNTESKGI